MAETTEEAPQPKKKSKGALATILEILGCCLGCLPVIIIGVVLGISGGDIALNNIIPGGNNGGTLSGESCLEQAAGTKEVTKYIDTVNKYAGQFGVDPALVAAMITQESHWNPNATSYVGAQGLMQLMPDTARGLGVTNSLDPDQNVMGGTKYIKQQLDYFKNEEKAIAAYNAGAGAVIKYGGIPPFAETQDYVKKVIAYRDAFRKCLASGGNIIATGDMIYPLPKQYKPANNFMEGRGNRIHAGVDILAPAGTPVYAIKNGKIVNYYQFTGGGDGYNTTFCIIVDHGDFVINYGEVANMSSGLKKGDTVQVGQQIGTIGQVTQNSMLHFEEYKPGTTQNIPWYVGQSQPSSLINPTSLLNTLLNSK